MIAKSFRRPALVIATSGAAALALLGGLAVHASAGSAHPTLALSVSPTSVSAGEAARASATYDNPTGGTTTHTLVTFTFSPAVSVLATSTACTPGSGSAVETVSCELGNVAGGSPTITVRVRFVVTEPVTVSAEAAWAEMGPGGARKAVNSVIPSIPASLAVDVLKASGADRKNGCADSLGTTGLGADNIVQTLVAAAAEAADLCTPIEIEETNVVGENLARDPISCGTAACTTAPSYVVLQHRARNGDSDVLLPAAGCSAEPSQLRDLRARRRHGHDR